MKKRSIRLLLSALLVLVMAFQSFAAPLSYVGPTAASEPAKITGTWSTDASGSWRFNAPDGAAKDGWYYLNTTNNATDYNWFCFDANGVMRTGWVQDKNDPSVWYYTGESKGSSEGGLVKGWITDPQDGKKYYLDPSTGIMCHGWKQVSGVWYYFGESRYADRKWAPDTTGYWKAGGSGKHSYGSLYMNEYTPDGYYVGANGAWVQNHSEDDNSDKPDPAPETKKLSEILPSGFPTSDDAAWVNAGGKKAYKDGDNIKVGNLTLGKDTTATKSGDNYVCKSGDATVTFNVKDGAAESITVTGSSDSNGTYAPAAPTFKAVYNTTGDANTLTFYYDTVDHSGEGITVYEDGTTNYLFDNSKNKGAKWGYNNNRKKIKEVVIDSTVANYTGLTSTAYMFDDMEYAENISGAEYLDVSQVTNMAYMFNEFGYNSGTLNIVPDVSGWNTGKVTNMSYMFQKYGFHSTALNAVPDMSKWNTVNVTTVTYMFYCYGNDSTALSTVPNVSKWSTGNLTNMASMFSNYGSASNNLDFTLDLSDWSVASVASVDDTGYRKMFESAATKAGKWSVTIPGFTGTQANNETRWYVGDGTATEAYIEPASGKQFTVKTTIADVLDTVPSGFPTSDDAAWVNAKGLKAYKDGDNIKVGNLTLGKDTTVTKSEDNYVCNSGDATVTFNVKDGAAESITVTGSGDSNGTYTAPETKALSEILPAGFPTSDDAAWVNAGGKKAYKDGDNIKVGNLTLGKDTTATKSGDNYVCKSGDATVTFNVKDGAAESITVTGSSDSGSNGTYVPAGTTFKAVYDTRNSKNTLTFYYDNNTYSEEGITVYEGSEGSYYLFNDEKNNNQKWGYFSIAAKIKSVDIDPSVRIYDGLTSTTFMFFNMTSADSISGAEYLDVSEVENMSYMFASFGSSELKVVPDVSGWNTSKVKNMMSLFSSYGKKSAEFNDVPDVSIWNTSNVTDMTRLFDSYGGASKTLKKVPDVSGWNTENVLTMLNLFNDYGQESTVLEKAPEVGKWNTKNVTKIEQIFGHYGENSTVLDSVPDVSNWNTSSMTVMTAAFTDYGESSKVLASAPNVEGWNTENVTIMQNLFNNYGSTSTELEFSLNLLRWNVGNVNNGSNMFSNAGRTAKSWSVTIPEKTGNQSNEVDKWYFGDGSDKSKYIRPADNKSFTLLDLEPSMLGASPDPVNAAPMTETEVDEPTAEVFEPEFEPEKFEEAKPEELIEPAEAVAEEAAP